MRSSVTAAARAFQTLYEGRCNFMYVDALGLVTTGIGNKIDQVAQALALPWLKADGNRATLNMIQDEWIRVKERQDLRGKDVRLRQEITTLHLAEDAIDDLFDRETARMWADIVGGYPDAEQWAAPSQLGSLSMVWAMGEGHILPGPKFDFPHWRAAALAQDWASCASECRMQGVGIEGRNEANERLFRAAAAGGDPNALPSV